MRADRLLSILLLLQINRRMTARELAERLEVSERTIHRDMEALGAAGVPVVAERGTGGGWMLMEGYRTSLTGLNEREARALFLNSPASLLADLKLDKAAEAAFLKLLATLPSVFRRDAEYVRQRIHVDVTAWRGTEETFPCLHILQEAIWQERKLRMVYGRGQDDCSVERTVDPLGLVAKGSVWYLVAGVEEGEVRSYRVSRIRQVEICEEPCVRPEKFDLAAYWQASAAQFREHLPRYQATLRVRASLLPRLPYAGRFARIEQTEEVDAEGWARVQMRFQFAEEAAEWVLSFGDQVEVVEPEELSERVVTMAEKVIAFYGQRRRARAISGA